MKILSSVSFSDADDGAHSKLEDVKWNLRSYHMKYPSRKMAVPFGNSKSDQAILKTHLTIGISINTKFRSEAKRISLFAVPFGHMELRGNWNWGRELTSPATPTSRGYEVDLMD